MTCRKGERSLLVQLPEPYHIVYMYMYMYMYIYMYMYMYIYICYICAYVHVPVHCWCLSLPSTGILIIMYASVTQVAILSHNYMYRCTSHSKHNNYIILCRAGKYFNIIVYYRDTLLLWLSPE